MFLQSHRARRLQTALIAGIFLSSVAACSVEKLKTNPGAVQLPSGLKKVSVAEKPPEEFEIPNKTEPNLDSTGSKKPEPLVMNLTTNYSDGRQRKNLAQLKDAIVNCVGTKTVNDDPIMLVSDSMIAYPDGSPAAAASNAASNIMGRKRFLLPTVYPKYVGKNILDAESEFLDVGATRTGLRADSIEDEIYLKSLVTVASVVAYNCDVKDPLSACYCADRVSAEQMIARCLPQFNPNSEAFQSAVKELYSVNNCGASDLSDDGLMKRRRAIASLLSSYAFATSK